jgi:hypothetical protein
MNDGLAIVILPSDEAHWLLWGLVAHSSLLSLDDLDSMSVFCSRLTCLASSLGGEVNICALSLRYTLFMMCFTECMPRSMLLHHNFFMTPFSALITVSSASVVDGFLSVDGEGL